VKWSALFCFSQFVSVLTLVFLGLPLGVAQEQPQTATETAAQLPLAEPSVFSGLAAPRVAPPS